MPKWQVLEQKTVKRISSAFNSITPFGNGDLRLFRIMNSGGIALSVIILQAYLGTGVKDGNAFTSALCFAIAIPLLATVLLVASALEEDMDDFTRRILSIVEVIGGMLCLVGMMFAFVHLSVIIGLIFAFAVSVGLLLLGLLLSRYSSTHQQFPRHR